MNDEVLRRIVKFLRDIGLTVEQRSLRRTTFLPGVTCAAGVLIFDPDKLVYPGDLLHEAGHLAVIPSKERGNISHDMGGGPGLEMAAIAWSYAALVFLRLPPETVFHVDGYKGDSASLCENFANGRYIGVPILEWRGLTDYQQPCAAQSATLYPLMKKWLCD